MLGFLRSIRVRLEEYHEDWSDGELYDDWDGLQAPFPDSDINDSDRRDSVQEIANGVVLAHERNDIHEYQRCAVEEYYIFLTWLSKTNRIAVYQSFLAHLLLLRSTD